MEFPPFLLTGVTRFLYFMNAYVDSRWLMLIWIFLGSIGLPGMEVGGWGCIIGIHSPILYLQYEKVIINF